MQIIENNTETNKLNNSQGYNTILHQGKKKKKKTEKWPKCNSIVIYDNSLQTQSKQKWTQVSAFVFSSCLLKLFTEEQLA